MRRNAPVHIAWQTARAPAGFLEAIKIAESGSPDRPLEYRPLDKMPHERRAFSWDGHPGAIG